MKTFPMTRVLFVAGAFALAGAAAQAQTTTTTTTRTTTTYTYVYPVMPNTAVLGAGPATVYSYAYPVYVAPAYVAIGPHSLAQADYSSHIHGGASETSNVPERAGEASTMTNGAPNVRTDNNP